MQDWGADTITWSNLPLTSAASVVTVPKSIKTDQSYHIDVTNLVQDMVNSPEGSHGFLLKLEEEMPYRLVIFASNKHPDSNKHPKLTVFYNRE